MIGCCCKSCDACFIPIIVDHFRLHRSLWYEPVQEFCLCKIYRGADMLYDTSNWVINSRFDKGGGEVLTTTTTTSTMEKKLSSGQNKFDRLVRPPWPPSHCQINDSTFKSRTYCFNAVSYDCVWVTRLGALATLFGDKMSFKSSPKYLVTFRLFLKYITYWIKILWLLFWATFIIKFRFLFIPTPGHTASLQLCVSVKSYEY